MNPQARLTVTPHRQIGMYRRMLLCRMFEERVYYLFLEGRLPGTIHQSQGQEAHTVPTHTPSRGG